MKKSTLQIYNVGVMLYFWNKEIFGKLFSFHPPPSGFWGLEKTF